MSEYDPSKDLVLQQDLADVEAADEAHKQQQFSDSLKPIKLLSHWLWNLPDNITVGSIDAIMNTADFMKEAVAGSDAKGESQDPNPVVRGIMNGTYAKNALMSLRNQLAQGSNTGDELTQAVAQFLVPFAGWSKLVGGLKGMSAVGTAGKVVAAESATAATALAPDEARLADLVAYGQTLDGKIGNALRKLAPDGSLANAYIRYITDRGDETRAEGRFKNVVDNLTAVGAVAAPLYTAAVSFKVARRMLDEGPSVLGPAAQRGSLRPKTQYQLALAEIDALRKTPEGEKAAMFASKDVDTARARVADAMFDKLSPRTQETLLGLPPARDAETGEFHRIGMPSEIGGSEGMNIHGTHMFDLVERVDAESTTEDALNKLLDRAFRRNIMEGEGQAILDDLTDAGRTPQSVSDDFWSDTYFRMNAETQRKFQRQLEAQAGLKPGDVTGTYADGRPPEVARDWMDVATVIRDQFPANAEQLGGTERGYVALMEWANRQGKSTGATQQAVLKGK